MGYDSSITAYFGGDTSGLRDATKEASIIVKGFGGEASRAVREIGEGFVGAVAIMEVVKAIKDLGGAAIEAAEKEREMADSFSGAVSDQSQAWLDLADTSHGVWDEIKAGATGAMTNFLEWGETIKGVVGNMAGVSDQEQNLFDKIGNSAELNIAKAQAASDKYLAELPAKQAQANAKLTQLDAQFAATQETGQDKVNLLNDRYNAILQQITQTNQVISSQEAKGIDASAAKYDLTQEQIALMQTALALQTAETKAAQDEVAAFSMKFTAEKSSLSVEDQITALKAQQKLYADQAAAITGNEAQQTVLKNAAEKVGNEIAADTLALRKATELSESDRIAMFEYETKSLQGQNTLTLDQYNLLKLQSQETVAQVKYQNDLTAGYDNGDAAAKKELATDLAKADALSKQVAIQQQVVTAQAQAAAAAAADLLLQQQIAAAMQQQGMEESRIAGQYTNADNPMAGATYGVGMFGNGSTYYGSDPSYGDNQTQINDSVNNEKNQIAAQIKTLSEQRQQLLMLGDPNSESKASQIAQEITNLQTRSQNAQDFLYQPGYQDALGVGAQAGSNPVAGSGADTAANQQTQHLANIDAVVSKALGGG